MENEKEIQELKERLASVENQLQRKSGFSGFLRFIVVFILGLFGFLLLIGIIQFLAS